MTRRNHKISLGVAIAAMTLIMSFIGAVFAYGVMPNRQELNELRQSEMKTREECVRLERYSCDMERLEKRLDRLEEKLDRQHAETLQEIRR